jgi:hypothetical protein
MQNTTQGLTFMTEINQEIVWKSSYTKVFKNSSLQMYKNNNNYSQFHTKLRRKIHLAVRHSIITNINLAYVKLVSEVCFKVYIQL